jgi:GntR family transcriptional regulator
VIAGPIYQVINRDIAEQISSGTLRAGDRLDSELKLAERYGVSRMTVRQALGELENDGLVVRRHGSGTYVSEPRALQRRVNHLGSFHEEMGLDSKTVKTRLITQEVAVPPSAIAADLRLGSGQTATHLVRLRVLAKQAIAVQESWIPYLLVPGLARDGLVDGSLYKTLKERAGIEIRWAEQQVTAAPAVGEIADLLELPPGSPVISIRRVSYTANNEPVEVAQSHTVPSLPLIVRLDR